MPRGVYIRTEENRKNLSKGHKGLTYPNRKRPKFTEEHKRNIALANTGKKRSEETRKKISLSKLGEKNGSWRGDNVKYRALHGWVERKLGKPLKCENPSCVYPRRDWDNKIMQTPKKYEWANISHEYKRDLEDWIRLCVSCHSAYDRGKLENLI